MSLNRYRIPGKLKVVFRQTTDGKPWLSKLSREDIAYCLGYSTGETGVVVHAALVLDDVCILVVTDTAGMLSSCTQRLHTCLTELSNFAQERPRGTIWDNRKPSESFVVGWYAALFAMSFLAVRAADAAGSDDPYDWPGYFGPELWGTHENCERPYGFGGRSIRPQRAWLAPKAPDCAPREFFLEDLVADADYNIRQFIAKARGEVLRGVPRPTQTCKPVKLAENLPEFIGPEDVVELLAKELRRWRAYYRRCRDEFKVDQLTVFPAGTDRFRALGAAVDPCKTYVVPLPPRRRENPLRGSPPRAAP